MADTDYGNGDRVVLDGEPATVTREYDGTNMEIDRDDEGQITVMPGHLEPLEDADVTMVDGVGDNRAETLAEADVETVGELVDADVDALVEAGLDEGHAEDVQDSGLSLLEG